MTMAAIAAGTDSLMVEVHPNPAKALSDGPQSLTPQGFHELMLEVKPFAKFFQRATESLQNPNQTLSRFTAKDSLKV